MTRAVLSPAAERDILEIIEWIAAENPVAAKGFRVALDKGADIPDRYAVTMPTP